MVDTVIATPSTAPGNAPNLVLSKGNRDRCWPSNDNSVNNDSTINDDRFSISLDAYPLVEDEQPTKTIAPPTIKIPSNKCLTPTSIMVLDMIPSVK
jgi:hypothetical protein